MKVLGLDIGATSVVGCAVEKIPRPLKRFFDANKRHIVEFHATREGVNALLALQPDIVAMEPSGVHYSEFWYKVLSAKGIEVRWVGHVQIKAYRKSQRLPDKNDKADALALACYCLEHLQEKEFFLRFVPEPASRLRRLCLQLEHLNRVSNPIVCCARQYLAHEFPEAAQRRSARQRPDDVPALWGWLAGERQSPFFDKLWAKSVSQDFGLEISEFTRASASRICDLERQQDRIEQEIAQLLSLSDFAAYNAVFDEFGFGLRTRALLLSHIYPLSDFLGPDEQLLLDLFENSSGKIHKRDRSERAFKLRLGMGLVEDASGKSQNWIPGGSAYCRQALWRWCLTRIEPKGRRRLQSCVGQELGKYVDELKAGGVPAKVAQLRCCGKAASRLFKALFKELSRIDGP